MIRNLPDDVRLAIRAARRAPVVTIVAIATLALGIGATTAIFTVANAAFLRPLPVRDPHQLVTVSSDTALQFGFRGGLGWNHVMWDRLRAQRDAFAGAFAWTLQRLDLAGSGEMQPVQVLFASGDFFAALGVEAVRGRTFTVRDDQRGGGADGPVAVLGFEAWERRFHGDPDLVGRQIPIEGVPVTVVGVAPRGFFGVDVGQRFDLAVPLGAEPLIRGSQSILQNARMYVLTVMLRLRPGQSIADAQATLRALQADMLRSMSDTPRMAEDPVILVPAASGLSDRSRLRAQYERPLVIVAVIAACVLIVGSVNLANVLLARTAARRRELGLRRALGASRWRLARQVIVDSGLLAIAGGGAGALSALWASRALAAALPLAAGPVRLDLSIDWRVAAYVSGAATLAMGLCGLLPTLMAARVAPVEALDRPARSRRRRPASLSSALIVGQVALSAVLVMAAEMFVSTAVTLSRVPIGFDADQLLVVTVDASRAATNVGARLAISEQLVNRLSGFAGVTGSAGSIWTPMSGRGGGLITDASGRQAGAIRAAFNMVTPGWFATYGTAIVAGRDFNAADRATAARVAVVNERFVRHYVPDGRPIGRIIDAGPCSDGCTVVGVVRDALYGASRRDPAPPTVYIPLSQSAGLVPPGGGTVHVTLRVASSTAPPTPAAIASALQSIDGRLTFSARPLAQDVQASFARERLLAVLAGLFGWLALLLAGLGLYGLTAHTVTRRRAEFAIRLALGADRRAIVALVLRQTALLVGTGLAIGLAAAFWLSRFVTSLLFGAEGTSLFSAAVVAAALATTGALAAWNPARRAARVAPFESLR